MAHKPIPINESNMTFKVLHGLMDQLFEPEKRRLQACLDRIIDQHEESQSAKGFLSFMYGGKTYQHSRCGAAFKNLPSLAWNLNDQMDAYLKDGRNTTQDRDLIHQAIFKCVYGWNDVQDFRNRLPEVIVPVYWLNKAAPARTVPFEEATCHLNERDKRQFSKILPKIELYSMARLIY